MKQDSGLVFDGLATGTSYTSSSKFRSNQYTGHSNDGRLVNKGRGPVVGNDGSCGHSGPRPPSSVPDTHAPGAYGKSPDRGAGGTRVKSLANSDSINAGPGPRKGNL